VAGRGPAPKPAATRQRTNKPPVRPAELDSAPMGKLPNLPRRDDGRPWHRLTRSMWRDVQRSPMVAEYLLADLHRLYVYAETYEQFWRTGDVKYAAELRNQGQYFGLTPLDRRRLQWEVQKVEKAAEREEAPSRARVQGDPRALLHTVAS
jgi:hypothetical protein